MDEWSLLLKCLHAHLLFHTGGSQCFNLGLCDFFVDLYPKHNFVMVKWLACLPRVL